jgi:arylsulfatase A-like enzyme
MFTETGELFMRTIFILVDSLNRHYLKTYGGNWVQTPNMDRLAERSMVFDNHFCGSMPCMPARREIWTGRYNFLETPWSPLQPYDHCVTKELKKQKGTYSHLITDHYHYWEPHGTGYNFVFDTWDFIRGQEGDPWKPMVGDPRIPYAKGKGSKSDDPDNIKRNWRQDWVNRSFMNVELDEDYPTVQCFQHAGEFLDQNHTEDNWHLHLEVFDPHEPFLCPQEYKDIYKDKWDRPYHFDWPDYAAVDMNEEGQESIEHIRKCYAGCVTRVDKWLGKLLDKMDQYDMWEDTSIILTSDHGHLLGEHGYWAKNYMFDYQELVHIPLIIYSPGAANNGRRISALTATIDLVPTLLELHEAEPIGNIHGKSLAHLFKKDEMHHDWVLYGYFGKDVSMTDGRHTYTKQPVEGSFLHEYTAFAFRSAYFNYHTKTIESYLHAEMGKFLEYAQIPVYKVKRESYRHQDAPDHDLIYDLLDDPHQMKPLLDAGLEKNLKEKMVELLKRYDAPEQQFARLGL